MGINYEKPFVEEHPPWKKGLGMLRGNSALKKQQQGIH